MYIRGSHISEYQQELICKDITNMMIEGQHRGLDMHDVIGDDYKEFCDNIILEIPKPTSLEKILLTFSELCLYACMVISLCIFTSLLNLIKDYTFPLLSTTLARFITQVIIVLFAIVVVNYICHNSFETNEKNSRIKFICTVILAIIMIVLSHLFLRDIIISFSFYVAMSVFVVMFIVYKVIDEKYN